MCLIVRFTRLSRNAYDYTDAGQELQHQTSEWEKKLWNGCKTADLLAFSYTQQSLKVKGNGVEKNIYIFCVWREVRGRMGKLVRADSKPTVTQTTASQDTEPSGRPTAEERRRSTTGVS